MEIRSGNSAIRTGGLFERLHIELTSRLIFLNHDPPVLKQIWRSVESVRCPSRPDSTGATVASWFLSMKTRRPHFARTQIRYPNLQLMPSGIKSLLLPFSIVLALGTGLGLTIDGLLDNNDTYEHLQKMEDTFLLINRQYVEEIEPSVLAESAIRAMLDELDPHSAYIDAKSMERVQEDYRGTFGGIGIWFEAPPEDTAKVTSTIPDGPGEAVGLMAGDRMFAVDDSVIVGMGSIEIQNLIKGPVGSDVTLSIKRPGVTNPFDVVITRSTIPLYSIDSSYMMDEQTGYVRIGRFAMTTHNEFVEHVQRLKGLGMQRLVLDLRGNPGGIKMTAVQIADEMLTGSGVIVTTEGRDPRENEIDRISPGGLLTDEPVIILVDESTASGSEIVSGAVQDHDRALIVGRRTFGKGLVQRPFQLRDGSVVQMTVARYFMPSGRLIQTPYETGHLDDYYSDKFSDYEDATYRPDEYLADIPDSLRYSTDNGRIVFGGGGVMPDIVIPPDSTSDLNAPVVQASIRRGWAFLYARQYFDTTEGMAARQEWSQSPDRFFAEFKVDENHWNGFVAYAEENGLGDDNEETDVDEGFSRSDLESYRETLEVVLKARMAQRLYRSEAWYPVFNSIDPMIGQIDALWVHARSLAENGTMAVNANQ
jgi:carboxyl-terminal processing protease